MELFIKQFRELDINDLYDILKLRVDTFILEQECFYEEIDSKDKDAIHIFLKDDNEVVAYLRLFDKGIVFDETTIGRVIAKRRREGLGTIILKEAIRVAKDKFKADKIKIEAQVYAKKFYENVGFKQVSDIFLEDGIEHIEMILEL